VRWRRPKEAPDWKTFLNWHYNKKVDYLCLVEGATDMIKLVQFGVNNTIPAKYFSDIQFRMVLNCGAKHLFLAYDEDEAGRYKISEKNGKNVSFQEKSKLLFTDAGMYIHIVNFPKGCKDPGDIVYESEFFNENVLLKELSECDRT
jgi:DNA primase